MTGKFCKDTKHKLFARRSVFCSNRPDTQFTVNAKRVLDTLRRDFVRSNWSSTTGPRGRDPCICRQTPARSPATYADVDVVLLMVRCVFIMVHGTLTPMDRNTQWYVVKAWGLRPRLAHDVVPLIRLSTYYTAQPC